MFTTRSLSVDHKVLAEKLAFDVKGLVRQVFLFKGGESGAEYEEFPLPTHNTIL